MLVHARQLVQKVIGRIVNKHGNKGNKGNKGVSNAPQLICGNNNDVIISVAKCLLQLVCKVLK